jgi:hypothetical protein
VLLSSFSAAAVRDTRDDQLSPATGFYLSANAQLAAQRWVRSAGEVIPDRSALGGSRKSAAVLAASARPAADFPRFPAGPGPGRHRA